LRTKHVTYSLARLAEPQLALGAPSPRVHDAAIESHGHRVPAARRHVGDLLADQCLDELGCRLVLLVAVSEAEAVASAPRVDVRKVGDGQRVEGSACDLADALATESLASSIELLAAIGALGVDAPYAYLH